MTIEKMVPVTVTIEAAIAARTPRAPSAPAPKNNEFEANRSLSVNEASSLTSAKARIAQTIVPKAGRNQSPSLTSPHRA